MRIGVRLTCTTLLFALSCQGNAVDDTRRTTAPNADGGEQEPAICARALPEPPPYCVAPCVWAVVKKCLPSSCACASQTIASPFDGSDVQVLCQPDTGWASHAGWVGGWGTRQPRTVRTLSNGGGVCYSATMGFDYFDRNFGGIALESDGTVLCASVEELLRRTTARLPDGGFSLDGLDQYVLDRSRPECDAWDEFGIPKAPCDATPGACPDPRD